MGLRFRVDQGKASLSNALKMDLVNLILTLRLAVSVMVDHDHDHEQPMTLQK